MNNFLIAFNAVLPVTLVVLSGYFFRKNNFISEKTSIEMNKMCFLLFLPFLTFKNIAYSDVGNILSLKLISFVLGSIFLTIVLCVIFIPFLEKDRKKQGVMVQGIYRSNFIILGIPIVSNIAGEEAAAIASILIMIVIPFYNVMAVIILSIYGGKKGEGFYKIILNILKNPLIISCILGSIFSFYKIPIPSPVEKFVFSLSKIGSSLPMFILGTRLNLKTVGKNFKEIFIVVFGKLVFFPLIIMFFAVKMNFSRDLLITFISLFCGPIAVASAVMAESMNCDGELATQVVVFSTIFSVFTVFLWIFFMGMLNII